ncbi:MAG: DUF2189 domain-containing protein [Thioalkalispiraceae bacterium]|jgi:uncharacterized membrane protein
MQQTMFNQDNTFELAGTRQVALNAPLNWLASGWRDYLRTPFSSSFYGLMYVLLAYAVTAASWQSPILVLTFVTGLFLITPFLALGLYDLSRQAEQTKKVSFVASLFAFTQKRRDMGLLVVFHALVMIAWIRLATIIGALYFGHTATSVTVLFEQLWRTGAGIEMIGLFALAGAALAAVVFISSAVSWPMILDRREGVLNAMATSIKAVMQNKLTMLVWAALIGLLFMLGLVTFYLGLLVILPVLGHATWHAYKELIY